MHDSTKQLDEIFTYHAPHSGQPQRYERIRNMARQYSELIIVLCPASHERDVAVDRLREVVMWANASIAVNE